MENKKFKDFLDLHVESMLKKDSIISEEVII